MGHQLYWFCVAMYIGGQLLMLFWFTIPQLKEKCRIANKTFTWAEWWSCDWNLVIGNMVFGAVAIMGLDEFINWKPDVLNYIKYFFAVLGAFGPTIVQEKWGSFKKGITKLLDVKANISDAMVGKTTTVASAVEKGNELTGMDVTKPTTAP